MGITREWKDAASCSMRKGKCFLASSHGNQVKLQWYGSLGCCTDFYNDWGGGSGDMGYWVVCVSSHSSRGFATRCLRLVAWRFKAHWKPLVTEAGYWVRKSVGPGQLMGVALLSDLFSLAMFSCRWINHKPSYKVWAVWWEDCDQLYEADSSGSGILASKSSHSQRY